MRLLACCWIICLLILVTVPRPLHATVITARQDGTGDFLTITDAVNTASAGDTIEVGPGTYPEEIDLSVPLSFFSTDGASSTIMDGQGTRHHLWFLAGQGSEVIGFKFINGHNASGGGSIRAQGGARVTIRDCVFQNNRTDFFAGAILVRDTGSRIEVDNSVFTGNSSVHNGGTATTVLNSELRFTNCTFVQNTTGVFGGAIATNDNGTLNVLDCVFRENTSGDESGAIYCEDTSGSIERNTFHANTSPGLSGTVRLQNSAGVSVTRNIFSGDTAGYGLYYYAAVGLHSCNVFWNNALGSIENDPLAPDEVEADPLFCSPVAGDLTISINSPAACINSPCGRTIGALPVACDGADPCQPGKITVRQDGTGDFLTIAEAVAVAAAGDTIEVGPGTYVDEVDLVIPLVFISTDGEASTILDGQGVRHHLWFLAGAASEVIGFRFMNGDNLSGGGSIRAQGGATVTIRDCHFENNNSGFSAGAIFVRDSGSRIDVSDCVFIGNQAAQHGGAAANNLDSQMSFTNCSFLQNTTPGVGGALATVNGNLMDVAGCLFKQNTGGSGSAMYYQGTAGTVVNNTLYANNSPTGTIYVSGPPSPTIDRNIFSSEVSGPALASPGSHSCNVFWANAGGPIVGGSLSGGDVVADPLFCDPTAGDFTISSHSQAATANSACGQLVGAFPVACAIEPPPAGRIRVRQDGTGDFLTITEAVAAAVSGDTIEVGPGTYTDEVDVFFPLVFVSTDGAEATIVDGQNANHHMWFISGRGSEVAGFKFVNGFDGSGGGSIRAQTGAGVTIRDCVFENNHSDFSGGSVFARDAISSMDVLDCVFRNNTSLQDGAAGTTVLGASMSFNSCTFEQNTTGSFGGALAAGTGGHLDVSGCLFEGNSGSVAGAVFFDSSTGAVFNCTFHGNDSPGTSAGTIYVSGSPTPGITKNILSGDISGPALFYAGVAGPHSCNVFWNNAGGEIVGDVLAGDEVVADPVFCDAAAGDFTISTNSPASAANSACGQLIGAFPEACSIEPPSAAPAIISILDVPNDNGRQVRIKWTKSSHDAPGQPFVITEYGIYRFQDPLVVPLVPPTNLPRSRGVTIDGWDFIATVPARGDDIYQFVAPTLCDSTIVGGICWSVFFVSAMTPDPLHFFDSLPIVGYSVDNLPPQMPRGLSVTLQATGNILAWDPSPDTDFDVFNIYRGPTENFTPGAATLVNSLPENQWTDPVANTTPHFYKISAVDDAGNESDAASPETVVGIGAIAIPTTYRLHQNAPNPFNPSTVIRYDVPRGGGRVTLQIFDVTGRLVRTVFNRFESAGAGKSVVWDARANNGQRVSSGVYFYRLSAAGFAETRKMTLLE